MIKLIHVLRHVLAVKPFLTILGTSMRAACLSMICLWFQLKHRGDPRGSMETFAMSSSRHLLQVGRMTADTMEPISARSGKQ
jgi:hypothetical protein